MSYQGNDRIVVSLATDRLIKVAVSKKGYILGATIIGENVSKLTVQWTIAVKNKLKIKNMPTHIVVYPILSELNNSDRVKKNNPFLLMFNLRTIKKLEE